MYSIYMALAERVSGSRLSTPESVRTPHFLLRERRHSPEKEPTPIIFVATETLSHRISHLVCVSESGKRIHALDAIRKADSPRTKLIATPGGPEDQGLDQSDIVKAKLTFGLPEVKRQIRERFWHETLLVASDVKSHTCTLDIYGNAALEERCKPKKATDVGQIFRELRVGAEITEGKPTYILQATSAAASVRTVEDYLKNRQVDRINTIEDYATIQLDDDILAILETPSGSAEYVNRVRTNLFRSGLAYSSALTEISGLLDFGTLFDVGAVTTVNGVPVGEKGFKIEVHKALCIAHGVPHADTLRDFFPNVDSSIQNWEWLQAQEARILRQAA
jgi:hypothetical protein